MYSIQLYVQYFGKNTVNTVILDVVQLKYSKKKIVFFFFLFKLQNLGTSCVCVFVCGCVLVTC